MPLGPFGISHARARIMDHNLLAHRPNDPFKCCCNQSGNPESIMVFPHLLIVMMGRREKLAFSNHFLNRANPPDYVFFFRRRGTGCFANPSSELHILIKSWGVGTKPPLILKCVLWSKAIKNMQLIVLLQLITGQIKFHSLFITFY